MRPSERQPPPPPQPVTVVFGTNTDRLAWYRLLFALYLFQSGRIGKGDLEAER